MAAIAFAMIGRVIPLRRVLVAMLLCASCGRRPADPAMNAQRAAASAPAPPPVPALPATAMRVEWTEPVLSPRVARGSFFPVAIGIRNAGDQVWPATPRTGAPYAVRVSHRWCSAGGAECPEFAARHELSAPLPPGESTTLGIVLAAPSQPGTYELQFDVVQELVNWFSNAGSSKLRIPVRVE